jgi:hypothetical protein
MFNPLNAELNPICSLLILLGVLTFMGPCIVSIFQYTCISNKMQRYTVDLYLETALHVSGGTSTHHLERTVSTASGICHTVTVIWRYRGRVGTGLSVLWVAYATHSTQTPEEVSGSFLRNANKFLPPPPKKTTKQNIPTAAILKSWKKVYVISKIISYFPA